MTETEVREYVWKSCIPYIIAGVEECSKGWGDPRKEVAEAIKKFIARMPVPQPEGSAQ